MYQPDVFRVAVFRCSTRVLHPTTRRTPVESRVTTTTAYFAPRSSLTSRPATVEATSASSGSTEGGSMSVPPTRSTLAGRPPRSDAQRNRDRIIDVALLELKADPDVALRAIAKKAGVGQGTLYR